MVVMIAYFKRLVNIFLLLDKVVDKCRSMIVQQFATEIGLKTVNT